MKKYAYRVDSQFLSDGEIITPNGKYWEHLDEKQKSIEECFEQNRKCCDISRKEALFLFEDITNAIFFCSEKSESFLYLAEIESKNCFFRADMNLIDYCSISMSEQEKLVGKYWNGEKLVGIPCHEFLAKEAKIIRKLTSSEECRKLVKMFESDNKCYINQINTILNDGE